MNKIKSLWDKLNSNENLDPAYRAIMDEINRQVSTFSDEAHHRNSVKLYQDIRDSMNNRLKALGE